MGLTIRNISNVTQTIRVEGGLLVLVGVTTLYYVSRFQFRSPGLGATLVTSGAATSDGAGLLTSAINTPSEPASDKFTLAPQVVAHLQCQYPNYLGPAAFDFRIVVQEDKGALTVRDFYI